MLQTYTGKITSLKENQIFVFGSNTEGIHGKGAAFDAYVYFGAEYGKASGFQGKSYGIITKDLTKRTHPSVSKQHITEQISLLYDIAATMPMIEFLIAYSGIGTNLNGYTNIEMAAMFVEAMYDTDKVSIPDNIVFEENFRGLVTQELIKSSQSKMANHE